MTLHNLHDLIPRGSRVRSLLRYVGLNPTSWARLGYEIQPIDHRLASHWIIIAPKVRIRTDRKPVVIDVHTHLHVRAIDHNIRLMRSDMARSTSRTRVPLVLPDPGITAYGKQYNLNGRQLHLASSRLTTIIPLGPSVFSS